MKRVPRRLNLGVDRFSGLYLWAFFIIAFSVWRPSLFPTASTAHTIASSQSVTAIISLALLIPMVTGTYDLSIGATANLSAIIAVWLLNNHGWPVVPVIIVAVLAGTVVGAINGLIVVRFHINSFICTLGMATVLAAVQTIVDGNAQPLPPSSSAWSSFTQSSVLGFQTIVIFVIVMGLLLWWTMEWTPIGRYLYAVGGNPDAARLSGIRVDRWIWGSLIASGTISGLAGVLYASYSGPSLTFGATLLLPAFAAVFLGSTQFRPGKFNVLGTVLAVYVLATGIQGLEYVTGVQWLNDMFNGLALIVAVGFAVWRQRAAASSKRSAATATASAATAS
jgi:ribose transport system permease protein